MQNQENGSQSPSTPTTTIQVRWSLSKLSTFEKCPAKYRFKYLLKIEDSKHAAASRGIGIHKDVEMFLLDQAPLPPALDYYQGFLTGLKQYEIKPEHKVCLKRDWSTCEDGAEGHWYTGILDLKLVTPAQIQVYDWKSGKIYPDHDDQKELYSLAAFAEHPTVYSVRAIHVYFDLNKNREKEYHRDQMPELRKQWEARVAKLERSHSEVTSYIDPFIPNPGYHCTWCSFSKSKGGPCRF
jgi:hypothetical protein